MAEWQERDAPCRSLLHKAVRRGQVEMVEGLVRHLWNSGQSDWVQRRTFVILAEECWPLLGEMEDKPNMEEAIKLLGLAARMTKNKDATALTILANSGVSNTDDGRVSEYLAALGLGRGLWPDLARRARGAENDNVVDAARIGSRVSPAERGLFVAAALSALYFGKTKVGTAENVISLPLWVALDGHTGPGKLALLEVSGASGYSLAEVYELSFWCEGSVMNQVESTTLWEQAVERVFSTIGLDQETAMTRWGELRHLVVGALKEPVVEFAHHLVTIGGISKDLLGDNHSY
jgi:hypothetical protein